MQSLLNIKLPKFARYGWIYCPRNSFNRQYYIKNKSRSAYLMVLIAVGEKWR